MHGNYVMAAHPAYSTAIQISYNKHRSWRNKHLKLDLIWKLKAIGHSSSSSSDGGSSSGGGGNKNDGGT